MHFSGIHKLNMYWLLFIFWFSLSYCLSLKKAPILYYLSGIYSTFNYQYQFKIITFRLDSNYFFILCRLLPFLQRFIRRKLQIKIKTRSITDAPQLKLYSRCLHHTFCTNPASIKRDKVYLYCSNVKSSHWKNEDSVPVTTVKLANGAWMELL